MTAALKSRLIGTTQPRIWTPPLRRLTRKTSFGFEVVDFAKEIDHPFDPWQEFAVIHGGELLRDGRPRFRIVLLLVARQNGKTEIPVVLSTWWQFRKKVPLVLGTSTQITYAKEAWLKTVNLVKRTESLDDQHAPGRKWYRLANGETESWTLDGARHKIAASNEEGGRSLTVHRGIADELRQHHDYSAWEALEPAASPLDAQIWALSNMGDDRSVVLNDLRQAALDYIETGEGDPRLGIMEWSAPPDSDPTDPEALAQANPNMGRRLDPDVLIAAGARAKKLGGKALAGFMTERLCVRVPLLNPAIEPAAWARCLDVGDWEAVRGRVGFCVDVAPDGAHATLAAAALLPDGRVRVEVVAAWDSADAAGRAQPALVGKARPRAFGWLPTGPAAALAADLADRGRGGWPPPGVKVEEIRGEVSAACMAFAELVKAGKVAHSDDPLLNAQVAGAERLRRGDGWVFSRRGAGHCDAVYAVAGAAHLARTLPAPVGKPRLIVAP